MSERKKTLRSKKSKPKKTFDKPAAKTFYGDNDWLENLLSEFKVDAKLHHNGMAKHYYTLEKEEFGDHVCMTRIFVRTDNSFCVNDEPCPGGREIDLLTTRKKFAGTWLEVGFNVVRKFTDEIICVIGTKNFLDKILYKKDSKLYFVDEAEHNVIEVSNGEEVYLVPACNLKNFSSKRFPENPFYRDIDEREYRTATFILPPLGSGRGFDALKDVGTFALYMGECFFYRKGFALISNNFATQAFNKHFSDKEHKIREMTGTIIFSRPYLCDSTALVVTCEYIDAFVEQIGAEKIIFKRDDLNETIVRDLQETIWQKRHGGKFSGKLVIVTDKNFDGEADYLTDLSAFRNPVDFRRRSSLNVFDLNKNFFIAEDNVTLEKSFVARLLNIDFEAGKALYEKLYFDYSEKRLHELDPDNHLAPSYADITNLRDNPSKFLFKALGKNFMQINTAGYQRMLDELKEELEKMLSENLFPTSGAECIALVDLSKNFGVEILSTDENCVEVFCPLAESEKIFEFVGSIPHGEESANFLKLVSTEEYLNRLKEFALPENLQAILSEHICKMSSGVILLPAQPEYADISTVKLYFLKDIIEFVWTANTAS